MDILTVRADCGKRLVTQAEWGILRELGWPGSDGSSWSTDTICGVRIGLTTEDWSDLPAPQHDAWYYVLRRMLYRNWVSIYEAKALRKRADLQHRRLLLAKAGEASFGWRTLYRSRCWIRWTGLWLRGGSSIVPRPEKEGYGE